MRSKVSTLLCVLTAACSLGLAACGSPPGPIDLDLTTQDYPRVDGSTSAHPLAMFIACEMLDVPCSWSWGYDGTRRPHPHTSDPSEEGIATYIREQIVHNGTHGAYVNLIEEQADLILVARQPSPDELALAREQGVELETKAVALDAFVFILNRNSPIESLTIEQIRGIYTGQITNWSQVGGPDAPIQPYQRNANSGSQELMRTLVMQDLEMVDAPEMMVLASMMGPYNALSGDVNGIGYSVYFYKEFMAPGEEIKLCAVDGIMPSSSTIAAQKYPFTTEVYAVIRKDLAKDSNAYQLRDWLFTEEGKAVIEKSGYVPIR
jgi:phosphate transport system substrate-binding protein